MSLTPDFDVSDGYNLSHDILQRHGARQRTSNSFQAPATRSPDLGLRSGYEGASSAAAWSNNCERSKSGDGEGTASLSLLSSQSPNRHRALFASCNWIVDSEISAVGQWTWAGIEAQCFGEEIQARGRRYRPPRVKGSCGDESAKFHPNTRSPLQYVSFRCFYKFRVTCISLGRDEMRFMTMSSSPDKTTNRTSAINGNREVT
jgi:hypothetical protein